MGVRKQPAKQSGKELSVKSHREQGQNNYALGFRMVLQ
jgi:hypothetical protein